MKSKITRITIISRIVLERNRNSYREVEDFKYYFNKSDVFLKNELKKLNEKKRSRFYEIEADFKRLDAEKNRSKFIEYVAVNHKEDRCKFAYGIIAKEGLDKYLDIEQKNLEKVNYTRQK